MFVNICKSDITERHFSKTTRRFVRLKRRIIFPNRRFVFYVFGLKVRKAHGFGRGIGDAPKFGGLREGFFLVVWKFLQALAKRNQKKRCL